MRQVKQRIDILQNQHVGVQVYQPAGQENKRGSTQQTVLVRAGARQQATVRKAGVPQPPMHPSTSVPDNALNIHPRPVTADLSYSSSCHMRSLVQHSA